MGATEPTKAGEPELETSTTVRPPVPAATKAYGPERATSTAPLTGKLPNPAGQAGLPMSITLQGCRVPAAYTMSPRTARPFSPPAPP